MSEKDILNLLSRIGSKGYSATDLGNGHADIEVTAAQASKLQEILGKDHMMFVEFDGQHVILRVSLSKLKDAAETNKKVSKSPVKKIDVEVQMVYTLPNAENGVESAWWESKTKRGGFLINGQEFRAYDGKAGNHFKAPKNAEAAKNWDPERQVYVVDLPTPNGEMKAVASYGFKNLIYKVCAYDFDIEGGGLEDDESGDDSEE